MSEKLNNALCEPSKLASQLSQARNELNNIRKTLHTAQAQYKGDVQRLEDLLESAKSLKINTVKNKKKTDSDVSLSKNSNSAKFSEPYFYQMKPVGILRSLHQQKNGTPRQGILSSLSRARLTIIKDIYNRPLHALEGLEQYSHIWLLYIFHQNKSQGSHAKVSPPRLDGLKVGVFSTRSPHRPNPVGLTLVKLDDIEGDSLLLSGVDMIDGTPIIDIKPYIPNYDSPQQNSSNTLMEDMQKESLEVSISFCDTTNQKHHNEGPNFPREDELTLADKEPIKSTSQTDDFEENSPLGGAFFDRVLELEVDPSPSVQSSTSEEVKVPHWIKIPLSLRVIFNPIANDQIKKFSHDAEDPKYRLEYLNSSQELKSAISSVLSQDPRSTYRRQKCLDRLYYFMVDSAHITACFFGEVVEVLRVSPPDPEARSFKLI